MYPKNPFSLSVTLTLDTLYKQFNWSLFYSLFIGGDEKKKKPKKEKKKGTTSSAKATPTSSAKATPSKTTKVTIEDVPEDDIEKVSSKIKILNIKKLCHNIKPAACLWKRKSN